jgi:hypothetical protein
MRNLLIGLDVPEQTTRFLLAKDDRVRVAIGAAYAISARARATGRAEARRG